MGDRIGLSTWFPDRPPTWGEAVSTAGALGVFILTLPRLQSLWWLGVGGGFGLVLLSLGLWANTALGTRIGQWFRAIGMGGRAVVIVLYLVAVFVLFESVSVPFAVVGAVSKGGLLAAILYVVAWAVWAGDVRGWRLEQAGTD